MTERVGSLLDKAIEGPSTKGQNGSFMISYADLMTTVAVFFVMLLSMSDIRTGQFDQLRSEFSGDSKGTLVDLAKELNSTIGKTAGVTIYVAEDGVRMDLESAALFETGRAALRTESLAKLTPVFKKLIGTPYKLDIEGHTDDRGFYRIEDGEITTNWSLSGRRAGSVAVYLMKFGFDESRLRIVGYAANKPKVETTGLAGQKLDRARANNRRVTILVR